MSEEERVLRYETISDPAKRLAHEGAFLKGLLAAAPGPRVLDMACATGVHAEFLASNGATLTARDIDEDSIARARVGRPHPCLAYEVHDMRSPRGGPFDLAIVMGNSLCMLDSTDDVLSTLKAMAGMLASGGLGFVHVVNYAALDASGPRHKVARKNTPDGEMVIVKSMLPAGAGAGALISFAYFERHGDSWTADGSQATLLDLRRPFLEKAAADAGLGVTNVFGDYDRSTFTEDSSPDLLLILSKP